MYVRTFLDFFMLYQLSGCIVVIKCSTLCCDAMTDLCQVTREVKAFLAPKYTPTYLGILAALSHTAYKVWLGAIPITTYYVCDRLEHWKAYISQPRNKTT